MSFSRILCSLSASAYFTKLFPRVFAFFAAST